MLDISAIFAGEDVAPSPEFQAALAAWTRGWNAVPLIPGKKIPCVKYKHWFVNRQSRADICAMGHMFAGGVAVVTGAVSGLAVIDIDGRLGEEVIARFEAMHGDLPPTLTHRSGSGRGLHYYFRHPGNHLTIATRAHQAIQVDVRGDKGICVLPPTLHKSGGHYTVECDAPPAPLPDALIPFIEERAAEAGGGAVKRTKTPKPTPVAVTDVRRVQRIPRNEINRRIVRDMLKTLPDAWADAYDEWIRVGLAVHDYDNTEVGLALFIRFSARCPGKAEKTDFQKIWASFGLPYDGIPLTIASLRYWATGHGWNPVPWHYI